MFNLLLIIVVDGEPIRIRPLHIILHKPPGYVCSRRRETPETPLIYDLLPDRWTRLRPVLAEAGRLDKWASGLVFMFVNRTHATHQSRFNEQLFPI